MILLPNYPRLERLSRSSPDLSRAMTMLPILYGPKMRLSGRRITDHCFETAEILAGYTTNPSYLKTALFHDLCEDLGLSSEDVKEISGHDGARISQMVTILSKRADLKNSEDRAGEYFDRLSKAIVDGYHGVGLMKLCDRLSNMLDLHYHRPDKRRTICYQTLNFYVPMAFYLGLNGLGNHLRRLSLLHIRHCPRVGRTINVENWKFGL